MSYVDFFSNLPNITIMGTLSLFFLTLMRMGPILVLAPFLGAKVAPGIARMGLAISVTFIFLPFLAVRVTTPIAFNTDFIFYALKEILIGVILGYIIVVPFYMVQTSGTLIDYLRGASIMQAQDPTLQSQTSPIGILYNSILIVIFFQINGPIIMFEGLLKSYELIPPTEYINPTFLNAQSPFWKLIFDLINQIVSIAIQLAAPSLVAILMAEMFLGIANRLAPQVQIAFLGMSIKSLLGLALLWAAWFFILKQFTKQSYHWLEVFVRVIHSLKPT